MMGPPRSAPANRWASGCRRPGKGDPVLDGKRYPSYGTPLKVPTHTYICICIYIYMYGCIVYFFNTYMYVYMYVCICG